MPQVWWKSTPQIEDALFWDEMPKVWDTYDTRIELAASMLLGRKTMKQAVEELEKLEAVFLRFRA